jgi:hypothetical protein
MLNDDMYEGIEMIYTGSENFNILVLRPVNTGEKVFRFIHEKDCDFFLISH